MRRPLVFIVLLLLLGGIGALVVARNFFGVGRGSTTTAVADTSKPASAGAKGTASATTGTGSAGAATAAATASATATGSASTAAVGTANPATATPEIGPAAKPLLGRPLRVVALGWDLVTPGLLANGGLAPAPESLFTRAGLTLQLGVTEDPAAIERALASGGATPDGADIAILPLQTFVASYERLRALAPEVFFVVGWSRGREGIGAADPDALSDSAGPATAKPATAAPGSGKPATAAPAKPPAAVKVVGAPGEPATFLALFVLDLTGIDPSRVRLVPRAKAGAFPDAFIAVDRGLPDAVRPRAKRLLVTTNDATALVPYVAIAPRGFAEANAPALTAWARVWLEGTRRLAADVPGAARLVATQPGAPEAVALLERLGWLEPATIEDNARLAALSGRSAVTLPELLRNSWRIWRAIGVLTAPAPGAPPASTAVIAELARTAPPDPTAGTPWSGPAGTGVLIDHRLPAGALDEAELVERIGFLAAIFERSAIRVTVARDKKRSAAVVAAACERFDLSAERVIPGASAVPPKVPAVIEVLAAP